MNNLQKPKWNWRKFQKGTGIRVPLLNDFDENGQQKHRPGIVIKTYPTHVEVQLLSTQSNKHDAFSTKINNKVQYVRPIYFRTININDITDVWKDADGKAIEINKTSNFFQKVAKMQYQSIIENEEILDLKQENKNYSIDQTMQIKNQRLEIATLKLKIQSLEDNQRILESENELIKSQFENQKLSENERE